MTKAQFQPGDLVTVHYAEPGEYAIKGYISKVLDRKINPKDKIVKAMSAYKSKLIGRTAYTISYKNDSGIVTHSHILPDLFITRRFIKSNPTLK